MDNTNKADEFRKAIKWFKNMDKPDSNEVFCLCVAAASATRQGSGLCWNQVDDIIAEVYNEEDKQDG